MSKLTDKFVRESDSKKCVGKIGMFISQTITQNYLTMKKKIRGAHPTCVENQPNEAPRMVSYMNYREVRFILLSPCVLKSLAYVYIHQGIIFSRPLVCLVDCNI